MIRVSDGLKKSFGWAIYKEIYRSSHIKRFNSVSDGDGNGVGGHVQRKNASQNKLTDRVAVIN